ncbi:MAG: aspartate--tRNA ligase [Thermodesulfobacteriota bacterium]
MDALGNVRRTHMCNSLNSSHIGSEVILMGWVQRRRDHGGVIFVDLRDREGITQVVFNPEHAPAVHEKAHGLRSEWAIGVRGKVRCRPEGMANPNLETGDIEIMVDELWIYNRSETPPFMIEDNIEVTETLRLAHRYLDLRRPRMVRNLISRHKATQAARCFLNENGFLDIETPVLTKSTPEGARDYLVPSRVNPGQFFALPQSPQLFKQLLMMAGYDRYYQIVRCFRDEDLRADRQPEFTQIDMELSFVTENDVMDISERLIARIFDAVLGVVVPVPFPRMTYKDAMDLYGVDKPDLRFGLPLSDVTDIVAGSGFKVFAEKAKSGGLVKALNAKGCTDFSRKEIDDLTSFVSVYGAKGLAWIKVKENEWQSPIAKFFTDDEKKALAARIGMEPGDLVFFVADTAKITNDALGNLRNHLGEKLRLIDETEFRFTWVTDFPLVEYDDKEKRFVAMHHPFTSPREEDFGLLATDPAAVRARAYDMVLNGTEIGGGSIRIHRRDLQEQLFSALGIGAAEAEEKFGFLLKALDFGAPPHGGIAFGLDRLTAILCNEKSIRDVIAFPKTQKAACVMTQAPSSVSAVQLAELSLRVAK